jgi:hypothetical protein
VPWRLLMFEPGSLVFYDDSDGPALRVMALPDQRAVLVDIPAGATSVCVVAPVWDVPGRKRRVKRGAWLAGRIQRRSDGR